MRPVGPVGTVALLLVVAQPVVAGELILANGSRLAGELANDVLVVSTGSDLVEVQPEQVGLLTPEELRLKDGRVIKGTVVGGRVKARTPLGELAIKTDELRSFRADGFATAPPAATPAPGPGSAPPPLPAVALAPVPTPAAAIPPASPSKATPDAGLPSVSLYQTAPTAEPTQRTTAPPVEVAVVPPDGRSTTEGRLEVIVGESVLRRDAVEGGRPVGKVIRGERVMYLDSVDRRLRIFNTVVFDGGHWLKVRAVDGTVGWLPAATVREVR